MTETPEPPAHTPWGYHGPGTSHPRKYIRGELSDAYKLDAEATTYLEEYRAACKRVGATPNSSIEGALTVTIPPGAAAPDAGAGADAAPVFRGNPSELLGGNKITLRDTYLGERGFLAVMPLIDRNTKWTSLDASNNGLRNEAVLHLVDMLLRPQHMGRVIRLDLSKNPISQGAAVALLELLRRHPFVEDVNFSLTKVPWRFGLQLRSALAVRAREMEAARREAAEAAERAEKVIGAAEIEAQAGREAADDEATQKRIKELLNAKTTGAEADSGAVVPSTPKAKATDGEPAREEKTAS